ncbi:MAG: FHA domain-containing protein [Nocardioides sp.]|nr:FHA domain-containing protein [Nocardioides sp.]
MTVTRSVVPGEWYAVLGDLVLVLLPPAARSRAAGLWELVDQGARFDEVLDALIRDGLRELPGFVLISAEAGDVKVVIRGEGEAELTTDGGPVVVSGGRDTTWVERHVTGVTGLRVQVAQGDGPSYAATSGLLRVAAVDQSEEPEQSGPSEQSEQSGPSEQSGQSQSGPVPVTPPPAAPQAPPPPAAPEPESYVAPAPAPADSAEEDAGDDTETQPGFVSAPLARSEEAPVARLIFSSGQVVDLDRAIVVGRSPEARRSSEEPSRLVTVPSPHQEISSTHLEIRPGSGPDLGSAVVTDLGSTNGTVVVQPGVSPEDLHPGVAVALAPGAIVDLGDGVTIQVTEV